VNDWLREYAGQHPEVAYCDTRAAVSAPSDPNRLLSSPDDLHPSAEGYKRAAQALEPVIVRAFMRLESTGHAVS
jgi:lysophospholipase L1-like esterase